MGIFDMFATKKDPEIAAIEKRAYEEEREKVRKERKNEAARLAAQRGKQRARETTSSTAERVGKGALKVGKKIMEIGEYGASLNWEGEAAPRRAPTKKGKGKRHQSQQTKDPFEMPEFPF